MFRRQSYKTILVLKKYKLILNSSTLLTVIILLYCYDLNQWSQTRGSRVGPMQPVNIRKNEDFKINVGPICPFPQKHWILTQYIFLYF